MTDEIKNIVIKNKRNEIVAQIGIKNEILHGHCEWYNGKGQLIAYGLFNNGFPVAGTFLNWANFFSKSDQDNDYDPEIYCKDWITVFESGFLSESPKYEKLIETYYNGLRIL